MSVWPGAWFEVTPESVARHIADRLQYDRVVDGTCGVGGNAIQSLGCRRPLFCFHLRLKHELPCKAQHTLLCKVCNDFKSCRGCGHWRTASGRCEARRTTLMRLFIAIFLTQLQWQIIIIIIITIFPHPTLCHSVKAVVMVMTNVQCRCGPFSL